MAHPNEELVRKGYAAFLGGDLAALNDLFADDIVWHAPGNNQLSGDFHGKDEVFGQFAKVFELTGGTFTLEIHDVIGNDEHTVVLARATGEKDGKKLDDNSVQVFHITGGKVTEQWLYPANQQATDEFWGQ
ncbi:MAG: nuclear transport factor 2 family protein [Actinomycetota bacterium]|nr:nuclear transport factor 2 family protein [Actinomycetota bacterium]